MPCHVFVDNSNIFGGAQRTAEKLEPGAVGLAVCVLYKNLFALLEDGREIETRVLCGSIPPGNEELWEIARQYGYKIDPLRRVMGEDGRSKEQSVDETVHFRIANALLDYDPPQTLVIATGDGQENNRDASFPRQIQRAIKHNWNVEVHSWEAALSGTFIEMAAEENGRLLVRLLDPQYHALTFIKGGTFNVQGTSVWVTERRAINLTR